MGNHYNYKGINKTNVKEIINDIRELYIHKFYLLNVDIEIPTNKNYFLVNYVRFNKDNT